MNKDINKDEKMYKATKEHFCMLLSEIEETEKQLFEYKKHKKELKKLHLAYEYMNELMSNIEMIKKGER